MIARPTDNIIDLPLDKSIEDSMREYGTMTVLDRAIPDYRDGLKPVHRRLLWAAFKDGNTPQNGTRKAARLVGETMGKYHPHGDLAIYGALVSLVNMPTPLVEGQGNWGNVFGDPPAAMRYPECRLHTNAMDLLLSKRYLPVTEMVPNYDGSQVEPVVLPARLPMSLITGARGIAVGVTTYFPTFTKDSVEALVKSIFKRYREEGKVSPVKMREPLKHLKFTCAGGGEMISDSQAVQTLFTDGRGKIEWQCAHEVDEKARRLIVTGLAPDWDLERRTEAFLKISEVAEVKNLSGRGKVHIVVQLRKSISSTVVDATLERVAEVLRINQSCVMNITERAYEEDENGLPSSSADFRRTDMLNLLEDWIKWRLDIEVKAALYEKSQHEASLKREETMLAAVINLDALIAIIKSKKITDKPTEIARRLKLDLEEAKWLWSQPISRLDALNEEPIRKRIAEVQASIKAADTDSKKPLLAVCRDLGV